MPNKLTTEQVSQRLKARGYELAGTYAGTASSVKLDVLCVEHDQKHSVHANGVVSGKALLPCCNIERIRKQMTGRIVSDETRRKVVEVQKGEKAYWYGKTFSPEHRQNMARGSIAHYSNVEAVAKHARRGATAGRPGHFYIFRVGDELKFGSVSRMTPEKRMAKVRRDTGKDCELLIAVSVPDAGAYEAAMMERHREHWIRHEFFRDFCSEASV